MTWRLPVRVLVFEHAANTCTPHLGVPSRRYTGTCMSLTASPNKTDGPQGDEPKP
jgi:hypothetical protein